MSKPAKFDFYIAKRIARYLSNKPKLGLRYRPAKSKGEKLLTYCYADASLVDERPHIGVAIFLGTPDFVNHVNRSAAVMVISKKGELTCLSTFEAELLALCHAITKMDWITNLRSEMGYPQTEAYIIFTDNRGVRDFLNNEDACSQRTRHLRLRAHYIREAVLTGQVRVLWVPTHLNCSDVLTKPLGSDLFQRHTDNLMGNSV